MIFASSFSLSLSFFCISEVVEALEMHFPCHGEKINLSFHSTCHSDDLKQVKTNFSSSKTNKFLRKFGIYDFDKSETSIYASGVLDLSKNKIKFQNIIKNENEKIGKNQLSALENSFNTHILKDGVLGIFDFFKVKKFILESY